MFFHVSVCEGGTKLNLKARPHKFSNVAVSALRVIYDSARQLHTFILNCCEFRVRRIKFKLCYKLILAIYKTFHAIISEYIPANDRQMSDRCVVF